MVLPRGDRERKPIRGLICERCRRGGHGAGEKLSEPKATPEEIAAAMRDPALPAADVLSDLRDFHLLKLIDEGATLSQAEVAVGYERGGASRKKLLGTEEFRLGMQYALIRRGVDRDRVAGTIAGCLEASRSRWNPVTLEFEVEADHPTRLRAADVAARLLDVMPRTHQATGGVAVVIINTNLEDHPKEKEIEGAYVVETRRKKVEPASDSVGAP